MLTALHIICASESLESYKGMLTPAGFDKNHLRALSNPSLVLARSEFGQEPLYYYYDQKTLIYGHTIPDIIQKLETHPVLDHDEVLKLMAQRRTYTDKTIYQHIYSVEPGTIVYLTAQGELKKHRYWQLDPNADDLVLKSDQAYFNRFDELMQESLHHNTQGCEHDIAGELSGGLDSSSILTAAQSLGLHYPLFMHVAPENPRFDQVDDSHLAKQVLSYFGLSDVSFVDAKNFDFFAELEFAARVFAGPASCILPVMAQNVGRAVAQSGKRILLSGAGGDECVSSHAPESAYLAGQFRERGARAVWQAFFKEQASSLLSFTTLKKAEQLFKAMHPAIFHVLSRSESTAKLSYMLCRQGFKGLPPKTTFSKKRYYTSIRAFEWDRLQGSTSCFLRGRIEHHGILANATGFEYRYPLLYPKLVEFCFHLPARFKRRDGVARYMVREYLKAHGLPEDVYSKQQKVGGIAPGTLENVFELMQDSGFLARFENLPWADKVVKTTSHNKLIGYIPAYMLHYYQTVLQR